MDLEDLEAGVPVVVDQVEDGNNMKIMYFNSNDKSVDSLEPLRNIGELTTHIEANLT